MRLKEFEKNAIKKAVQNRFKPGARTFLFGSRIDEKKHGGDIDLYVETELEGEELMMAKLLAMVDIQRSIGDRKIDIVTASPKLTRNIPAIIQKAKKEGIPL